MKLKVSKKRTTRYLEGQPPKAEVNQLVRAYSRAATHCEQTGTVVPLEIQIGLKRFEKYLGYRVKA